MPTINEQPRTTYGDAVGATLVTTLYARAEGYRAFGLDDWHDEQAARVWRGLEERTWAADQQVRKLILSDRRHVVGTIKRSQAFDDVTREFAAAHPGATVVSLGIGLCNRAARLHDLDVRWVGLDREPVITLRHELIPDEDIELIAASATDSDWLEVLPTDQPSLVIAEGLFMYLPPEDVTHVLEQAAKRVPADSRVVADIFAPGVQKLPHPIKKTVGVQYYFAAKGAEGLAAVTPGWRAVKTIDTMSGIDAGMARMNRLLQRVTGTTTYGVAVIERT